MTHFDAYLLTRLDNFNWLFTIFIHVGVLATVISMIFLCIPETLSYEEEGLEKIRKVLKRLIIFLFVPMAFFSLLGKALTPTTKEAAFIYIAPAIVNNQDIQETVKKIPQLSSLGLEYLSDVLKEEIKEKVGTASK